MVKRDGAQYVPTAKIAFFSHLHLQILRHFCIVRATAQ
jgi:hypothetical protein